MFRFLVLMALLIAPIAAPAHDVPDEVTVLAFLKPEGDRLSFLVRAPLRSLRDVDIPTVENGYLDVANSAAAIEHAAELWIGDFVRVYEDGRLLPAPKFVRARVSLPGGDAFDSYESARALIEGPALPPEARIYWEQGVLDVEYEFPISTETARFAIEPGLTRLGVQVNVLMRYLMPDGTDRLFDVHADVGRVALDPSPLQAAGLFFEQAFRHVLGGLGYILVLVALALPAARRSASLRLVVPAFLLGQLLTLFVAGGGLMPTTLWFPALIGTLTALAILLLSLENVIGVRPERRWVLAFLAGLAFGFAVAFLLRDRMQFAGGHPVTAVLAYAIGVVAAELVVLLVAIPILGFLWRHVAPERVGVIVVSAIVAHSAWHRMVEQGEMLRRYPLPRLDAVALQALIWWAMAGLTIAALVWGTAILLRPHLRHDLDYSPPAE